MLDFWLVAVSYGWRSPRHLIITDAWIALVLWDSALGQMHWYKRSYRREVGTRWAIEIRWEGW